MTFNRKQIITALFIAGPFAATLVLARNYKTEGKKTTIYEITGFLLAMVMYAWSLFIIESTIARRGLLNEHDSLINVYAVGIFVLVQLVFGLFLVFIFQKRLQKYFPKNENQYYPGKSLIPYYIAGIGLTVLLILFGAFRFFFLLVYMVPHYYIFNRVSMVFRKPKYKKITAWIILLLMLLFPVTEIFYNYYNQPVVRAALRLSYFYLPFVLYFFMALVLFEILLFILTQGKVLDARKVYGFPNWKTTMAVITLFSFGMVVYAHIIFNSPDYTTYNLEINGSTDNFENLKVVVASDFHFAEISSMGFVKKFVSRVNAQKPDLVLFPGDIVESDNNNGKMNNIARELTNISSTYGIYASLGNHEYYGDLEKNIRFCEKAGMQMLMDSAIVIDSSFVLAGQNDIHDENQKSLHKILDMNEDKLPVLLMRHRPINFEDAVENNVSLMVSGHTHHGQLFPFHLLTKSFYELSWGHLQMGRTHFITTSGAQGWGPQARTTGKSEIVVVNLTFK